MDSQTVIYTDDISSALRRVLAPLGDVDIHVVTDTNVASLVMPGLDLPPHSLITVPAGDMAKNLESLSLIWNSLAAGGATRRSVVVNIGGGMVTDMGGFAAATFKRGIRFINVPTTLLGAVDAAVGGKTGINLGNLKNEVGAFAPAMTVIISATPFATLPPLEILSGYAEIVKHSLLSSTASFHKAVATSPLDLTPADMLEILRESVEVKRRIVAEDPTEHGLRKALNLGHTVGHAFESHAMHTTSPIPHGVAVAHGMMVELIISHMLTGFPGTELHVYRDFLRRAGYSMPAIDCRQYQALMALMAHDKKNPSPDRISFTLLSAPGQPLTDRIVPADTILSALDIYREML